MQDPPAVDAFDETSRTLFLEARELGTTSGDDTRGDGTRGDGARGDLSNEDDAAEDLLVHYLPRLRAFVRARLGEQLRRRESASDIVQSVCRELAEERGHAKFEFEPQFRAWLFTAALNKIRERARFWRAEKRDDRRLDSVGDDRHLEDLSVGYSGVFTPSRVAAAREQLERLETALDALDEDHREVIALARIARLPHDEIAQRMGRSVGAVRQLLGRALRTLADRLRAGDDRG
jgi:RNA polymerase sigma-70 factor, ECF subfamily